MRRFNLEVILAALIALTISIRGCSSRSGVVQNRVYLHSVARFDPALQRKNRIALSYDLFRSFSLCSNNPIRHGKASNRAALQVIQGRHSLVQIAPSLGDLGIRVRMAFSASGQGTGILEVEVWEHYLGFELQQMPIKTIKLSMIRLGSDDFREEVVIRPGLRYAIVKVTNDKTTAHKGTWSWTAQEVNLKAPLFPPPRS